VLQELRAQEHQARQAELVSLAGRLPRRLEPASVAEESVALAPVVLVAAASEISVDQVPAVQVLVAQAPEASAVQVLVAQVPEASAVQVLEA
jgi:hypothetical protein